MGQLRNSKIIIVIICLSLTSFVLYMQGAGTGNQSERKPELSSIMRSLGPWHDVGDIPLAQDIVDALKLDDFLFRNFSNGQKTLSLYIGYYNSRKKVGAAHDPMVCFPGQGWVLSNVKQNEFPITVDGRKQQIHYSTMTAERNGQRELLLYWFQAYDQATPGTLAQKISLLRSKVLGGGEDNAFVRVGYSMDGGTEQEALGGMLSFVEEFYPVFYRYITTERVL